jgi:hypothetical protein
MRKEDKRTAMQTSTGKPVFCGACGEVFPLIEFSDSEYQALQDRLLLKGILNEIAVLLRIKDFFERNPVAEQKYKPSFIRIIESKDPKIREQLQSGMPFSHIESRLDSLELPQIDCMQTDREIIEYLTHSSFSLPHRLQSHIQLADRLTKEVPLILCPTCNQGDLNLDPKVWEKSGPPDGWCSYVT